MLERITVTCPACDQQVEAIARDGRVSGYCAIARKYVNFGVKQIPAPETETEMPASPGATKSGRDSKGHFIKGNIPLNTKRNKMTDPMFRQKL